jgi:hypothetical protein
MDGCFCHPCPSNVESLLSPQLPSWFYRLVNLPRKAEEMQFHQDGCGGTGSCFSTNSAYLLSAPGHPFPHIQLFLTINWWNGWLVVGGPLEGSVLPLVKLSSSWDFWRLSLLPLHPLYCCPGTEANVTNFLSLSPFMWFPRHFGLTECLSFFNLTCLFHHNNYVPALLAAKDFRC